MSVTGHVRSSSEASSVSPCRDRRRLARSESTRWWSLKLDYGDFLHILLSDEVSRRDHGRLELRLHQAGFDERCRLEDFDWSAQVRLDRRLLDAAFSLQFLDRREHVLLVGPVGVGKSFLAPDLVIIDDLGLHRLTAQQSIDFYELVVGRHRRSSLVVTSNRGVDEWLGLFDDPSLGNSALDRLANAAYQIVIEGESYRQRLSPHRSLLAGTAGEEAIDSTDVR